MGRGGIGRRTFVSGLAVLCTRKLVANHAGLNPAAPKNLSVWMGYHTIMGSSCDSCDIVTTPLGLMYPAALLRSYEMTIFKCDKCEKTYETKPEILIPDIRLYISEDSLFSEGLSSKDLCVECQQSLRQWWVEMPT